MSMEDVLDRLRVDKDDLNKWVGVYIGVLAVLLAICGVGGANAAKDATRANIEAANTWAFYQAKNIRRTAYALAADNFELMLATQPGLTDAARKSVEDKIKVHRAEAARMKSEPKADDGMDQLFLKAKTLETERDIALRKDPYFDWSEALLQIAIVLASVSIISGGSFLLIGSGLLGIAGTLLTVNGFTMAVPLPFI